MCSTLFMLVVLAQLVLDLLQSTYQSFILLFQLIILIFIFITLANRFFCAFLLHLHTVFLLSDSLLLTFCFEFFRELSNLHSECIVFFL